MTGVAKAKAILSFLSAREEALKAKNIAGMSSAEAEQGRVSFEGLAAKAEAMLATFEADDLRLAREAARLQNVMWSASGRGAWEVMRQAEYRLERLRQELVKAIHDSPVSRPHGLSSWQFARRLTALGVLPRHRRKSNGAYDFDRCSHTGRCNCAQWPV